MAVGTIGEAQAALESVAPPRLAGAWDNVGLLVEGEGPVSRALLCVDLTRAVFDEARELGADWIVAYHPPLFAPVKRLTRATTSLLLDVVRSGVHLSSPHTALDAAEGGLCDWLLEPFGPLADVAPIEPDRVDPRLGAGRVATLARPRPWSELRDAVATHLGAPHLRVAGDGARIARVAVCPGAGGSVFDKARADLYLTGEMRHHDVLGKVGAGATVVLSEHTHTERGYLPRLAAALASRLGVNVHVSRADADPLRLG